jgi:hypothetical protein
MIELILAASLTTHLLTSDYEVDSCVGAPFEVVNAEKPKWPLDVRVDKGFTEFKVYVGSNGKVIEQKLIGSYPKRIFDKSSKRAIAKWIFNNSKYQERCFNIKLKYHLSG